MEVQTNKSAETELVLLKNKDYRIGEKTLGTQFSISLYNSKLV